MRAQMRGGGGGRGEGLSLPTKYEPRPARAEAPPRTSASMLPTSDPASTTQNGRNLWPKRTCSAPQLIPVWVVMNEFESSPRRKNATDLTNCGNRSLSNPNSGESSSMTWA